MTEVRSSISHYSFSVVHRVSSASWYFLNVFGLRSMYSLILGEDNAADQTRIMQEQMSGAAVAMQQDPQKAFKVCGSSGFHQLWNIYSIDQGFSTPNSSITNV